MARPGYNPAPGTEEEASIVGARVSANFRDLLAEALHIAFVLILIMNFEFDHQLRRLLKGSQQRLAGLTEGATVDVMSAGTKFGIRRVRCKEENEGLRC